MKVEIAAAPAVASNNYKTYKLLIVIGIWVFSLLQTLVLSEYFFRSGRQIPLLISVLLMAVYGFGLILWSQADCRERQAELGKDWMILMLIFTVFGFFGYLLRSRGFGKGMVAILTSILIILVASVADKVLAAAILSAVGK
jgi:hypothetical protein